MQRTTFDATACRTLSIREAASLLGFGRSTLYEQAKRGELPVIRLGRSVRISREVVERMLADPARAPKSECVERFAPAGAAA